MNVPVLGLVLKPDPLPRLRRRLHKRTDGVEHHLEMPVILPFHLIQSPYEYLVGRQYLAHFDECTDDVNARFDGSRRIENGCRHDGAVLREGKGKDGRMFQPNEPVAFCDQFRFFIGLFPPWKGFSSGESIYRAAPGAHRHDP